MKKILIAASTLIALSAPALAERSDDLRNMSTYTGKYAASHGLNATSVDTAPLQVGDDGWVVGLFGQTKDPLEARRWSEKNN